MYVLNNDFQIEVVTTSVDNYAIAVSMPASRFKERLSSVREALKACQRAMESAAGAV